MTMTPEQLRESYPTIARMADAALNETVGYQKYALEGEASKLFIAHAAALEEIERLKKENDTLRGLLGNSAKPCPYCGLPAEDQAKCPSGFPGCARADDQTLSKHFADAYRAEQAERRAERLKGTIGRYMMANNTLAERAENAERRAERLKFHAEAMAHYTDCYKDKWPDSGARQTLDEYRAEFKEE